MSDTYLGGAGDEVDGTCSELIKRQHLTDTRENDSSYETDEEGQLSDSSSIGKTTPETNRRFWKLKESKVKKQELMTGLACLGLQDPGQDHDRTPTNGDHFRRWSYSSEGSSTSSEVDDTGIKGATIKLRAETSRTYDCQMRLGQEIHTALPWLPKTSKPVYSIKFDGYDDDQDTIHLWRKFGPFKDNTYSDLRFFMKDPKPLREPTPDEEGRRHDEVDASPEASSDDDNYPYRLARVVNDTKGKVVAIHVADINCKHGKEDGKNVFSIQWKVTLREDGTYILCDTVEHTQRINDLILAVTTKAVRMVTMNEHPEDFQNPNTKIAIWSISPAIL